MSSNDVSQQSQSASRSSFKTAYIPNSANSYNLELKTVQNAFSVLHGVLDIFSDIETDSNSKNLMRGMSETAFFEKTMKSPKKNGGIEIGEKEKILAYFQLSTSSDEFQNIINKFQQDFCTGRDSTMTEADFKRMLNFLGKKENIGRTKMEKLFKKLVTQTFETCDRLDRSLGSKDENELGGYLANGVFQLLKHEVTVLSQESRVDNLKLLPLLIGFHSRLLEARISKKAEILENIIGLNSKGKRIKSSEVNLYEKFESLGKKIEKKASISLSYKDVEKALSLFISSSPDSLSPQQKDLVLQDLQGKYKYSKKNEEFARSPVYNLKFLTYLASRICVRGIKATEQQALLQEYTEWNIVLHAEKLDSEKLGKKFLKYAGKRTDIEKPVSLKSLDNLFSSFIAKVIPTIHKKVTESVLMEYLEKAEDKQEFKLLDFSEKISRLLFRQAEAKLETYIRFVYELTTPSHSPIYRSANSSKQVSFREYNQDSQTKGVQIVVTPSALETELANNEGLHHREVSFAIPVESDNDKSQSFEDSIQFTLKKELSINIPQQSADFISQPRPHSRTVSGSQTVKAEKKSVNRVFWSSTASPSKQLSEIEERKDESPHQEYLNSCFVKEALLNSSPSGRVTYPKGKKKRAPPRKLQFAKQNQDEEETMTEMTKETFSRAEVLSEFETSVKSPDAHNSVENSRIELQTPGDSFPKFSEFMESYKKHREEKSFQNLESGMAQLETDGKDDKDRSFCDMSKCNLM